MDKTIDYMSTITFHSNSPSQFFNFSSKETLTSITPTKLEGEVQ